MAYSLQCTMPNGGTMIRGIYKNASSMQYLESRLEVVSNNLANSNTNGFKRSGVLFDQVFNSEQHLVANNTPNIKLPDGEIKTYQDSEQGSLRETGNTLNFAINGTGYFTIQTPNGTAYTRDGQFSINGQGMLVTSDGYNVLGESGPITVGQKDMAVSDAGDIMVDGNVINKFQIKNFDTRESKQIGNNLYKLADDSAAKTVASTVKQGYLENSNVNVVEEMVSMITTQRYYEANHRVLRAQDDTLSKAVNEVAR